MENESTQTTEYNCKPLKRLLMFRMALYAFTLVTLLIIFFFAKWITIINIDGEERVLRGLYPTMKWFFSDEYVLMFHLAFSAKGVENGGGLPLFLVGENSDTLLRIIAYVGSVGLEIVFFLYITLGIVYIIRCIQSNSYFQNYKKNISLICSHLTDSYHNFRVKTKRYFRSSDLLVFPIISFLLLFSAHFVKNLKIVQEKAYAFFVMFDVIQFKVVDILLIYAIIIFVGTIIYKIMCGKILFKFWNNSGKVTK